MSWLKGYITSRGFGVHSPFAFGFLTDVLCRSRYRYYAYDELEGMARGRELRDAELLHRVAVAFPQVSRFGIVGKLAPACRRAIELSGHGAIVAEVDEVSGPVVIVTDKSRFDEMKSAMKSGMSFCNGSLLIIVNDSALPLQHFQFR